MARVLAFCYRDVTSVLRWNCFWLLPKPFTRFRHRETLDGRRRPAKVCGNSTQKKIIHGRLCKIYRRHNAFNMSPKKNQIAAYSGHKRNDCLKYQATMFVNGIISHLYWPLEGWRHDAGMLRESGLLRNLAEHCQKSDGRSYCLYGDPAYSLSLYFLSPFKGARLVGGQQEWNRRMSRVRQAVEWGFGNVVTKWAFVDFKKIWNFTCNQLTCTQVLL